MSSLTLLKFFEYALPLLTIPYLVRTLGIGNFGVYSFATAFMSYFVVITNYGFDLTATRDISINRSNKEYIQKVVSTVYTIKILLAFICFLLLLVLITFVPKFNHEFNAYLITFILVIGNVLFPVWFFQGIENMKYITFLNITAKLIVTLSIFILVNDRNDYVLALFINSFSYLLPGIMAIFILYFKYKIKWTSVNKNDILKMINEGWNIFVSTFLGNIVASSGTFILGLTSSNSAVGIYSSIEKIVRAVIGLFTPITQALFPYISAKFAQGYNLGLTIVKKAGKVIMLTAVLIGILIILLSQFILKILYGAKVAEYSLVMQILVVWLIISVLNNIIGYQYLIASEQEKKYTNSFLLAGSITIFLYLVLSVPFSMYGIIFAMLIGELSLTIFMLFSIRRDKLLLSKRGS
nr:flippase [Caldibacillus thermoamylovorans]